MTCGRSDSGEGLDSALASAGRVILVGCVKGKRSHSASARDLYTSPLFQRRRRYAEAARCPWFILSAEYGLVHPDAVIDTYDTSLSDLSRAERQVWADKVLEQIRAAVRLCHAQSLELHAGSAYLPKALQRALESDGLRINRPLAGLGIGRQLAWYGDPPPDEAKPIGGESRSASASGKRADSPLVDALMSYGAKLDPIQALFPTVVPEAQEFAISDPFAFAVATCLDRGTRAEIIWTVPWDLRNALGHLDSRKLADMSASDLERVFGSLPRKPRYWKAAGRTTQELARLVVDEFEGSAAGIWTGRRASEVRRTLQRLHGVGPALGNMAVLLIERAFDVRFEDLDRPEIDIKPDVQTVRVLHRLGVAESADSEAAMRAARRLNPSFPGELDAPLWSIGRNWCRARTPLCAECPVASVCPSAQRP